MEINIGIDSKGRKEIAKGLSKVLADTYLLYVKTHNYHWNVTGPMFRALHMQFEEQYTELAAAVDEIAERIRALGEFAPGSLTEFSKLSKIEEETGHPDYKTMIANLVKGHETVVKTAREVAKIAQENDDDPTDDLMTVRMQTHEKNAWMLRAMLEE